MSTSCCARRMWRRIWATRIDNPAGKTHLTSMGIEIKISSKGQVVIPKDMRDALQLVAGGSLFANREGNRIILEAPRPVREKISYEEFRRRVPKYKGPPVAVEDMTANIGELFKDWQG